MKKRGTAVTLIGGPLNGAVGGRTIEKDMTHLTFAMDGNPSMQYEWITRDLAVFDGAGENIKNYPRRVELITKAREVFEQS